MDIVDVLVPSEAVAAARRLDDLRRISHRTECYLKEPGQKRGTVGVGECRRLLRWQRVPAAVGAVLDIASGRLGVEPLTHVALGGAGPLRKLARGRGPALRERPVEPEPVAHHDERRVEGRSNLTHGAKYELLEPLGVDLG